MDYRKCVTAAVLEAQKLPSSLVDDWLELEKPDATPELEAARRVCTSIFQPRAERDEVLALFCGGPGVGKTFATVAALGEVLVDAHRRREAGALTIDRPRGTDGAGLPPSRLGALVQQMFQMDLASYETHEKLFPGVLSGALREALEEGEGWDWEASPLTFAFWRTAEYARADVFGDAFREELARAKLADLVIVDDLGADAIGPRSQWASILDELVSVRHAEGLPLLMTSNLRSEALRQRYGGRIADRVRDRGVCLENNGPSRRQRRATGGR